MNEELRPTLIRWHYELLQHEARHPAGTGPLSTLGWVRRWALESDCRDALAVTRRKVVEYVDTLGRIAGAQSLAAAVIAGPASQIFTPHRLEPPVVLPPRLLAPGPDGPLVGTRRDVEDRTRADTSGA